MRTGTAGGAPKRTRHTDGTPASIASFRPPHPALMNQGLAGITVIFTIPAHGSRYLLMVINTLAVEAVSLDLVTEQLAKPCACSASASGRPRPPRRQPDEAAQRAGHRREQPA